MLKIIKKNLSNFLEVIKTYLFLSHYVGHKAKINFQYFN